MDMKKILQALDGVPNKPKVDSTDMKRFVSIVTEGAGPLNRLTPAESIVVNHYSTAASPSKSITSPVLNIATDAKPSMVGKYFKMVEEEFDESAQRYRTRASQLAERVAAKMTGRKPVNESDQNPIDSITLNIPLLLRLLEYAKEDAKTDMDLHRVAENIVKLGSHGTLSMDAYDAIIKDHDNPSSDSKHTSLSTQSTKDPMSEICNTKNSESLSEGDQWRGTKSGSEEAEHTDHTYEEAQQYIKTAYPFHKTYSVHRAEPGFVALFKPSQFAKSISHMTDVDAGIQQLRLKFNAMMSGSDQASPSFGYSWGVSENTNTGIAVLYYQDRGMGSDQITIASKTKQNLAGAVAVFRDAGIIPELGSMKARRSEKAASRSEIASKKGLVVGRKFSQIANDPEIMWKIVAITPSGKVKAVNLQTGRTHLWSPGSISKGMLATGGSSNDVAEDLTTSHKELSGKVKSRAAEKQAAQTIQQAKNPGQWKWNKGDVILSRKTGKTYRIVGRYYDDRKNRPMYFYERGDKTGGGEWEQGSFDANKAHEAFTQITVSECNECMEACWKGMKRKTETIATEGTGSNCMFKF